MNKPKFNKNARVRGAGVSPMLGVEHLLEEKEFIIGDIYYDPFGKRWMYGETIDYSEPTRCYFYEECLTLVKAKKTK